MGVGEDTLEQSSEFMPQGISDVEVDLVAFEEDYGMQQPPLIEKFDIKGTELITTHTIDAATHILQKLVDQSETGKTTVVISPVGAIPLNLRFIENLVNTRPDLLSKVDYVYAIPVNIDGQKQIEIWIKNSNGWSKINKNDSLQLQPAIMLEDIIDSCETDLLVRSYFPMLNSIAAISKGKDPNGNFESTTEAYNRKYNDINNVNLQLIPKFIEEMNVSTSGLWVGMPGINVWYRSGMGMDGGGVFINQLDLVILSKVELYERLSKRVLYGEIKESNFAEYIDYLLINVQDRFSGDQMRVLQEIIFLNIVRKQNNMVLNNNNVGLILDKFNKLLPINI